MRNLLLLVLALAACTAAELPYSVPQGSTLLVAAASDWVHVREPGWFAVDLPSPPRSVVRPDRSARGAFAFKKTGVETPRGLFLIHYVELGAEESTTTAREIIDRYAHAPPSGTRLEPIHEVTLDGAAASAIDGTASPNSDSNAAAYPIDIRVRVAVHEGRLFQLQCSAPRDDVSACDRFFASFKFE